MVDFCNFSKTHIHWGSIHIHQTHQSSPKFSYPDEGNCENTWFLHVAVSENGVRYGLYPSISDWWFGTFFIFPYIGKNNPNWLVFFRRVETTNQISYFSIFSPWESMGMLGNFSDFRSSFPWLSSGSQEPGVFVIIVEGLSFHLATSWVDEFSNFSIQLRPEIPVISTKKTPFIECFLSHRNNQL